MRLQASFVLLLLIAPTATTIVWRDFAAAREGDTLARFLAFAVSAVALISITLLGRIVLKVRNVRDAGRER